MNMSARDIAVALGGRLATPCTDGAWLTRCPCPGHGRGKGDRHPSLSLKDGDRRVLLRCFAGCSKTAVITELLRRGLLDAAERGTPTRSPKPPPSAKAAPPAARHDIRKLWDEGLPPHGTPVEIYLAGRKLELPPLAHDVLRYHEACPFGPTRTPVMLALVRSITTNKAQALHCTAIDRAGNKAIVAGRTRNVIGPTAGGAVKITDDADVTYGLGIAEGVESALSLQRIPEWLGSPVWSVLSESGIRAFPLLACVETLVIAVDHDPAGAAAAREAAKRWHDAGREVLLVQAKRPGADLNDVVRQGGARHAG
jgi:putative DNA primase/helicase